MPARRVAVLGAGHQAVETTRYLRDSGMEPAVFVAERVVVAEREVTPPAPVLTFGDDLSAFVDLDGLTAVGDPAVRRRLVELWAGAGWVTLVSERAWVTTDAVGLGTTIAPMAALSPTVVVGEHVLVNVGAILSHDVVVGDFATISPGVTVGGVSSIGPGAFVGVGATIRDRISIGAHAFVAAGAVVVDDVRDGERVAGVPARPMGNSIGA